ncbi:MAG: putative 2-aminoethylphosphonate ABC transporter ATP-binding protein [Rhodospirillales bacterium]
MIDQMLANPEPVTDASESYLQVRRLYKKFGAFEALKDIHLDIEEGEFVCFLGPSGCGKTTLLRAIAGLDMQTSGRIIQNGEDITFLPPTARDYGIVFQSYALFPNLTIRKNISFGLECIGASGQTIKNRVDELLALVGLPDQGHKYPAQLSGGQQQRVALARALAVSPGLLLLDEPLSALDAKIRLRLRHEIKELQRRLGVTTIMVTHDQEEALAMADRVVVMDNGTIEQIGSPLEVYRHPTSMFVADFIGETNKYPVRVEDERTVWIKDQLIRCMPHKFPKDTNAIAVMRPNDIIPYGADLARGDNPDTENSFDVKIESMEFLGSFWRAHLKFLHGAEDSLVADFSINAERRLSLAEGKEMTIEIPDNRILIFPV